MSFQPANAIGVYFRGLPRYAKINPRTSAMHRSRLANLRGTFQRGCPDQACQVGVVFSLLIAPQISRCLDLLKSLDSQTLIKVMVIPATNCFHAGTLAAPLTREAYSRTSVLGQLAVNTA